MGTYQKGILGSFQGKVGTVIGSSWNGIEYMRSLGRRSNKTPTQKQLVQRAKFSLVTRFVNSMGRLLMISFRDTAIHMTGINSAFAYNFDHAIAGDYPDFSLDYARVLVSKGQLHNAVNPVALASGNGVVTVNWEDNSGTAMANAADKSIVVVYCPELSRWSRSSFKCVHRPSAGFITRLIIEAVS